MLSGGIHQRIQGIACFIIQLLSVKLSFVKLYQNYFCCADLILSCDEVIGDFVTKGREKKKCFTSRNFFNQALS